MSQQAQVVIQNVIPASRLNSSAMNHENSFSSSVHLTSKDASINPVPASYTQSVPSMVYPSICSSIGSNATATTAGETSMVSMPVAMPLSGLTTIPLALCAMGGAGNIGRTGMIPGVQAQPGVPHGGIVLLNVPGTSNTNIAALSQFVACGNQGQQAAQAMVQPMVIGGNGNRAEQQPSMQIPQQNQLPQAQHTTPVVTPVPVTPVHQVPVTPPAAPQGGATAYMLVPIHQVPPNNQFPQVQQVAPGQPGVGHQPSPENAPKLHPSSTAMQGFFPVSQPPLMTPASHQFTSVPQYNGQPAVTSQIFTTQTGFSLPVSSMEPTTVPLQTVPTSSTPLTTMLDQSQKFNPAPVSATPINDPHISSSVPTKYKGLTSLLTPAVLSEIQKICETTDLTEEKEKQLSGNLANEIFKSLTSEDRPTQKMRTIPSSPCTPTDQTPPRAPDTPVPTTFPEIFRINFSSVSPTMVTSSISSTATTSSAVCTTLALSPSPSTSEMPQAESNDSLTVLSSPDPTTSNLTPPAREKRKKGPAPKLDGDEICLVCTDKASGYHYGVLSCEGCKGFFRRSVIKNPTYKCKADGQCKMDSYMRRKCQFCRLNKCRQAGMKDENVLSEINGGKKAKRIKKETSAPFVASARHFAPNLTFNGEPVPTLTSQQRNVVEMLQMNEARYQWPTQEDVAKVTPWVEVGDTHRCRASRFAHFTELAILIVQLVVEFTKQLPGFLSVTREDQILLLKACTIEVMLLRAAKQYDKMSKAINFLNGRYYDKSSFYRAGMQVEFVDPIFDFCDSMARLDLDEAEYALLVAINTFSADRPNLKDIGKVEAVQDSYVQLLRIYLKIHHPEDPLMFPRTLMKLVELRTLNNYHSEQIFALKVQDKQLPPLLAEIWDM